MHYKSVGILRIACLNFVVYHELRLLDSKTLMVYAIKLLTQI